MVSLEGDRSAYLDPFLKGDHEGQLCQDGELPLLGHGQRRGLHAHYDMCESCVSHACSPRGARKAAGQAKLEKNRPAGPGRGGAARGREGPSPRWSAKATARGVRSPGHTGRATATACSAALTEQGGVGGAARDSPSRLDCRGPILPMRRNRHACLEAGTYSCVTCGAGKPCSVRVRPAADLCPPISSAGPRSDRGPFPGDPAPPPLRWCAPGVQPPTSAVGRVLCQPREPLPAPSDGA